MPAKSVRVKCCTLVALVLVATTLTGSTASGASTKAAAKRASLAVVITGLETKGRADVALSGPGFHRTLVHSVVIRQLRPGSYTLTARSVRQTNGVEHAGPAVRVKLKVGKETKADVGYFFIPFSTRTITKSETVSVTGSTTGPQTIVLRNGADVSVGDILASGPTVGRPKGYLVKVESVLRTGGRQVLKVANATLSEAVPDGSMNLAGVFNELSRAFSAPSDTSNLRADLRRAHASTSLCEGGTAVTVTPSFSVSNFIAGAGVSWGGAHASLSFAATGSVTVAASGALSCTLPDEQDGGVPIVQGEGETIPLDLGIPITLTPTYALILIGSAQVYGQVSDTISTSYDVNLGANAGWSGLGISAGATPAGDSGSPGTSMGVTATLGLVADVGIEVDYDVGGVGFDVGPTATLTVSSVGNPWWQLQGCLVAGWNANAFGISFSDPSAINLTCSTIDQALPGTPVPPVTTTTTTTTTAPSTTTTTAPPSPPLPDFLSKVAYGDGRFVAIGALQPVSGGNVLLATSLAAYSTNGVTWHAATLPSRWWDGIAYGNGVFLAVSSAFDGARPRAAVSTNGVHWKLVALPNSLSNIGGTYQAIRFRRRPLRHTVGQPQDHDCGLLLQRYGLEECVFPVPRSTPLGGRGLRRRHVRGDRL